MEIIANQYEAHEIFRMVREWTGLTQKEFAKLINRSERTIQYFESGETQYPFNTLLKVAKQYGIKIVISKKGN